MNDFLVHGGYVLTMDPALGDLPGGEVHVRDGEIVAVGPRLDADCPRIVRWLQWVVLPIYLAITALAIAPGIVQALGLGLTPLQTEAIVLALLLFFGVQSAWFLLVEPTNEERRDRAKARDAEAARTPAEGI